MLKKDEKELVRLTRQLFNLINEIYFDNKLERPKSIKWVFDLDKDLWAFCYDDYSRLKLSVGKHAAADPIELWDTLMHECLHMFLGNGGHGLRWRQLATKYGVKLSEEIH